MSQSRTEAKPDLAASSSSSQPLFDHDDIAAEYIRWQSQVEHEQTVGRFSLSAGEVLKSHFLLADHFRTKREGIGGIGPKSLHLLNSAVGRQWSGYGGKSKWVDLTDIAATLFYGLVCNHPFHDANKRTALLSALYQLKCHDRIPSVPAKAFEEFTVRVAERALCKYSAWESVEEKDDPEVLFISRFFRRNTRKVDKRHYVITFRQLDRILRRYGARLDNPSGNRIDVLIDREEVFLFRKRLVTHRATQIGFHDWGTEVARREIDHVRKELGLNHTEGIDSAEFFQGVDPVESLIAEYRAPLERLAFK